MTISSIFPPTNKQPRITLPNVTGCDLMDIWLLFLACQETTVGIAGVPSNDGVIFTCDATNTVLTVYGCYSNTSIYLRVSHPPPLPPALYSRSVFCNLESSSS